MSLLKNNKGFTIVELLVVITIIAILSSIARPSVKSFLDNIRLRAAVNTVKQHLIVAKTRALGDPNIHAGVFFDTSGTPGKTVVFVDSLNDNLYASGIDQILVPGFSLPASDTMKIISPSPNTVIFRGDGSAKTSIKLTFSDKTQRCYTISVLASTGRIKVARNF
jgi:prepilin-type N-terminal cleavage/methylation domain-containing protein